MAKEIKQDHSPRFELVKTFYDEGLWTEEMVNNAVGRWITEEEKNEILNR